MSTSGTQTLLRRSYATQSYLGPMVFAVLSPASCVQTRHCSQEDDVDTNVAEQLDRFLLKQLSTSTSNCSWLITSTSNCSRLTKGADSLAVVFSFGRLRIFLAPVPSFCSSRGMTRCSAAVASGRRAGRTPVDSANSRNFCHGSPI